MRRLSRTKHRQPARSSAAAVTCSRHPTRAKERPEQEKMKATYPKGRKGEEIRMLCEYRLQTQQKGFHDITAQVREAIAKSGVVSGIAVAYCPHTTAGITINENADPDVARDLLLGLDKAFPEHSAFRHAEGNSPAHLKASALGASATVIIDGGALVLGTWQGIYFTEFDPPRSRTFYVKVL